MSTSDFSAFSIAFGALLKFPSTDAVRWRKALGRAIHSKLSGYENKQRTKAQFVSSSLALSSVVWKSTEPYKIINNLKNSGNGDFDVAMSLLFTCCKIYEFHDFKESLGSYMSERYKLDRHDIEQVKLFFKSEFHLSQLLQEKKPSVVAFFESNASTTGAVDSDILVKPNMSPIEGDSFGFFSEPNMNKFVGRNFVEIELYQYISRYNSIDKSCVSILDIDGLTKINKIFETNVGNIVLQTIYEIISEEIQKEENLKCGRCGDDTYYIVLCGHGIKSALTFIERLCIKINSYKWNLIAAGLHVSVSAGVARGRALESSTAFVIRAAEGMKTSKEAGGNRVSLGPAFFPKNENFEFGATKKRWS